MNELITDVILPWGGIFLTIYLVYYAFRYQYSKNPLEKQLYNVYLPMFILLEPHLYKKVDEIGENKINEIAIKLNEIVTNHYELVRPSIVFSTRQLIKILNEPNCSNIKINEVYSEICYSVDKEFEKTRKKMFLPTRNIEYKLNSHQYSSKGKMIMALLAFSIPPLLVFLTIAFISLSIFTWLSK